MSSKITVMTIVGTRPEIIRLAPTIKALDKFTNHILVHTGQNYDHQLNEVFFQDLQLRKPDIFLSADTSSLASTLGTVLIGVEKAIIKEKPNAVLILGDTNSCISAIIAKRLKVPVYHMEAGNRCFDENVPEETNRKIVDHTADYNLVYSEHARTNLLSEGISPNTIFWTGSPMKEVLQSNAEQIESSKVIQNLGLEKQQYFVASVHRQENVDNQERLISIVNSFEAITKKYRLPILVSTHPRLRNKLSNLALEDNQMIRFHEPFGFNDYIHLQQNAKLVLSDSGTISEESSILHFPAITLRDSIERPEALDTGSIITTGTNPDAILSSIELTLSLWDSGHRPQTPSDYEVDDVSLRVVKTIVSTCLSHNKRNAII